MPCPVRSIGGPGWLTARVVLRWQGSPG